jgi:6-pyruvoyltetrahydropterin/6-carboxytetrahydropterin synthase
MGAGYSIKVYKQYFNFASSHFLIFEDGTREPIHGHNYRVQVEGEATQLKNDMVLDFLHLKPIVREVCNELDHRLLLPAQHSQLKITSSENNWQIYCPDGDYFSIPKKDVLLLPIPNTSAERLSVFLWEQIKQRVLAKYGHSFSSLQVEVEETPGQSALYRNE